MINLILGRWKKRIITDLLVRKFQNQDTEIVIDLDQIKQIICDHIYEWIKDKSTSTSSAIDNKLDKKFELKSSISEGIINGIIETISLEELDIAL